MSRDIREAGRMQTLQESFELPAISINLLAKNIF